MLVLRNQIYYRVKPLIPARMRTAIRRQMVLRLRKRVSDVWPIMPGSERVPAGWPGWPDGKKFALVLTHDVERPTGLERCRDLMKLEERSGFRSSFNFVPEGKYRLPVALRNELVEKGFEIGVHDLRHDGHLYASPREFTRNANRINHYLKEWGATGFRSAFMLHKLDWLHQLDIRYDSSTFDTDPFEPQPEGRYTIFPFWVASRPARNGSTTKTDLPNEVAPASCGITRGGYVELPYTLPQDSTLFILLGEKTPELWLEKLDWIAQHGGMALIDTHPDYMNFGPSAAKGLYPSNIYEDFLNEVRRRYGGQYWNALPREVAAYVARDRGQLVTDGAAKPLLLNGLVSPNCNGISTRVDERWRLRGKRGAVVLFSYYPSDPRPRRAAEALAREGITFDFICLRKEKSEPRRAKVNGIHVIRISIKRERGSKWSYIRQYSSFIFRAFVCLAVRSLRRPYDFVHVHNMPDVLVFSALVPKVLGAKVILDQHDPVPELMQTIFELPAESRTVRLLKRLEKSSVGFADHVLTVNEACKKIYSSRSCAAEKITVILNSPDENAFVLCSPKLNGKDPNAPFTILYHGSLLARNGFDLAVAALAKLRRSVPQARLTVCGETTPFFTETMEFAAKLGVVDYIDYIGVKNRAGVVEVINSCDVGVIPNRRNIFTEINTPTRIFECLALGKPVVAPRAGGICDYFGDDGLIFFELGNVDDLAKKLEFAYLHPDETTRIVERGQEIYQAHSWSHQKSNLLDAVSSLL